MKNEMHKKLNTSRIVRLSLAFLIPLFSFIYIFNSVSVRYKDGYTILTSDLLKQYVNYFIYFRNALLNHTPLTYSFSGVLGNDMMGIITYYILSPFNLLMFLFPAEKIPSAVFLIIALKISFAGSTFNFFISKYLKTESYLTLVVSTVYALSGYTFAVFFNLMWLDGVYMLPLIAYGLIKLVREGKMSFYAISLGLAIIFNYYIGFMLCIASVLMFAYLWVTESRSKGKDVIFFSISSISGGLIAMVSILPALYTTVLANFSTRTMSEGIPLGIIRGFDEVLSSIFTGTYISGDLAEGEPQIYMGLIPIFFLILFFLQSRARSHKIVAGVIMLFTGLGFIWGPLNYMWYAFTVNQSFNYRYGFIFIFFALLFASDAMFKREEEYKKELAQYTVAFYIVVAMLVVYVILGVEVAEKKYIIIDAVTIIFVFLNIIIKNPETRAKNTAALLIIIQIISLSANAIVVVKTIYFDDGTFGWFVGEMNSVNDILDSQEEGFYRTEKTFYSSHNDPMLGPYYGLSHFSSSPNTAVVYMMEDLGYNNFYGFHVHYEEGATLAADSLMGVRYLVGLDSNKPALFDGYTYIDTTGYSNVYLNSNALEIGTMTSDDILNLEVSSGNPFEYQQNIYDKLLGHHVQLFNKYELKDITIESNATTSTAKFSIEVMDDNPIYFYNYVTPFREGKIIINGVQFDSYYENECHSILCLGEYEPGEVLDIELSVNMNFTFDSIYIYSQNTKEILEAAAELKSRGWTIDSFKQTDISATVTAEGDNSLLFTTIPYSECWKVYIDGRESQAIMVMDSLMGIEIPTGTHTVRLVYKTGGLRIGTLLTLIGLLATCTLLIVDIFVSKKQKKTGNMDEQESSAVSETIPDTEPTESTESIETSSEALPEPIAETVSEPAVEPEAEKSLEPVAETTVEPEAEKILEPMAEPVVEPEAESISEPVAEPIPESAAEAVTAAVSEHASEPVVEPVDKAEPETNAEEAVKAEPGTNAEEAAKTEPEPIAEEAAKAEPELESSTQSMPLKHEISIFELNKDNIDDINDETRYTEADYVVIDLPTEYEPASGSVNAEIVNLTTELMHILNPDSVIVIKSAVPTGFIRALSERLSISKLVYSPRLIDNYLVIAGIEPDAAYLKEYGDYLVRQSNNPDADITYSTVEDAEKVKLMILQHENK